MNVWNQKTIDLSSYAGAAVQLRFCFDTIDGGVNSFNGWYIDDVLIEEDTTPPEIVGASPSDGTSGVSLAAPIVVTFSEPMATSSVALTSAPNPGGWSVTWASGNTIASFTHNVFTSLTGYTVEITAGNDSGGNPLVAGGVPNPWTFTTENDPPPTITQTSPADGATDIAVSDPIGVVFSEPMDTSSVFLSSTPNPGGWVVNWASGNTIASFTHNNFTFGASYTVQISGTDLAGQNLVAGAAVNPWTFSTVADLTPPATPTLQSPSNGAWGKATPIFTWTSVTDPSGVTYDLQISTDPFFGIIDINKTGLATTTYTLSGTPPELLSNGTTYNWRVQAVDGSDNQSGFSGAYAVTVDSVAPQTTYGGFSGTLGDNGWYTATGQFSLSASDVPSGVYKTYYSFGGGGADIVERPYIWIDATIGTDIGLAGDDIVTSQPIGFTFPFFGGNFTTVYIDTNGKIGFTESSSQYNNIVFPSTSRPNTIAVLWDDLVVSNPPGKVYLKNLTSPNRLVIEWNDVQCYSGGTNSTFEVILYETGEIVWSFNTIGVPAGPWSATVGMNKGDGVQGYTYSSGNPPPAGTSATNETATEYTTPVAVDTDGEHTVSYYSVDNAGNAEGVQTAEINIDSTDPSPAEPALLATYTFATADLVVNWATSPGLDALSGIVKYEVERATDGVDFSTVYSSTATDTLTWLDAGFVNGQQYTYRLKTFDAAGNSAISTSTATTILELTAPADIAEVRDGAGSDEDYISHYDFIVANWDAASDPETGIQEYWYRVGTSTGTGDLIPWTSAGTATLVAREDIGLIPGYTYYFSVKAVNGAGLESATVYSDGQKVDVSPPDPITYIYDGTGSDVNYITTTTDFSANWDESRDDESGIKFYNVYAGTSPWATDVISLMVTQATYTTIIVSLTEGQTYYVTVEAVNGAGEKSAPICSNGQTLDTSILPAPAYIYDGLTGDVDYTDSSSLSANWVNVTGADKYWVAVGSAPGGTEILAWTNVGNTSFYMVDLSASVVDGTTYFFSVKAEKTAGKFSEMVTTDGVVYDGSAPVFAGVQSAVDTGDGGEVSLSWPPAQDSSSPITYSIYQATDPGAFNYSTPAVSGVTSTPTLVSGLTDGTAYYFVVRARDPFGREDANTATASATPSTEDRVAPATPTAFAAAASDQQVSLSWVNPVDEDFVDVLLVRDTADYPETASDGTLIYQGAGTEHADGSLVNSTAYYYSLFACDDIPNCSRATVSATPVGDQDAPAEPSNFTVIPGDKQAFLSWENPADADFDTAKLVRSTTGYPISVEDGTLVYQGTGPSHIDTSLTNDTVYYYTIFACDPIPNCSYAQTSTTPRTPRLQLSQGWNLISLSVNPSNAASATIFLGYNVVLCGYEDGAFIYGNDSSFTAMAPGIGYWVYSGGDVSSLNVAGTEITADTYEINLSEGWNTFGNPFGNALPWGDEYVSAQEGAGAPVVLSGAGAIVDVSVYSYSPAGAGYVVTDAGSGASLAPWSGYWIKALKNCTLILKKP